jgi:hypothetical protein
MRESRRTDHPNGSVGVAGRNHRRSARLLLALGALSCTLVACSTRTSEREIEPWFKESTSYFKFGSFAEGPNGRTYRARHFGFLWLSVDDVSGAVALSDAVVLLDQGSKGRSLLTRDAYSPTPVCPMYGEVSVPPSTSTVDCLLVNSDPQWGGPGFRRMAVKRTNFDGTIAYEKTIDVTDNDHTFEKVNFYDATGAAYFLAISIASRKDKNAAPDCMLLHGFGQDTRVAARRPDITDVMQCFRTETWEAQIGPTVARWDTIKYRGR